MASTVSLYTGLSGLTAHSRSLEVIGNNIANVNTTAFKSSRAAFADAFYQNLGTGAPPRESRGGTNPYQVGTGVRVAATQRDFRQGSIAPTGDGRDLAIDGNGLFVVNRGDQQFFTRAGAFRLDQDQNLVTVDGDHVQGFLAGPNYVVNEGVLETINIPLGGRSLAEATTMVAVGGNLNAAGPAAVAGSLVRLLGAIDAGLRAISGATVPPAPGNLLEPTSLLREIEDPLQPGTGATLFSPGETIELWGARKGNANVPAARLPIDAATTVQDLMTFLAAALGIQPTGQNADGGTPGVALDPATGIVSVTGNAGTVNDLDLEDAIRLLDSSGAFMRHPFVEEAVAEANGESVRTTFIAYNSLGSPVAVNLSLVLESKENGGTTWRYYAESGDDSDVDLALATGTVRFDSSGALVDQAPVMVPLDLAGSGAATPLTFNLDFAQGGLTALASATSEIAAISDGSPSGTLEAFAVDRDGTILGTFSNNLVRPLGRIALALFTNPEGLAAVGSNLYRPGANSGPPVIASPGRLGAGAVVGGALESSNVDLGEEFIRMILTSTGYSASSRVIRTSDELLQQLLVLGR